MPEINALEPVSLRQVWPDEARDFTPWLAAHLHLLGAELNGGAAWEQGEDQSWVGLRTEAVTSDPMLNLEAVGQWIADNLLRLRAVVLPYLDQVMEDIATSSDDEEDAE
jgi:hypothetical protein